MEERNKETVEYKNDLNTMNSYMEEKKISNET